ncbi:hypothetical protein BK133_19775 [Paenibacillus sp. FSL H8-0548]|uniref:hypothetical protein n=1 Tax=Paenibacillus sp. FSL H8-0548 TaxID=1920422 RepID=UPI00096C8BD4|nr:hypothetical protein [Paenibacillus sp. FSL H8-0548]OMF27192.1 hypothetical protein BK133_19775 [Paenibacillus sp. FSL H8-0548]
MSRNNIICDIETGVCGEAQALGMEVDQVQSRPVPPLASLLDQEIRLFSKEIEVMYAIEQREVHSFIANELSLDSYTQKEIVNEVYIEIKQK